jgi:hypothetical protein
MISPVFKEQLMSALHTAVGHFNGGDNPDDAVVKSAVANDFNAEQARRLCETFNIARTIYHFKSAGDKTATFPLADPDSVVTSMYKEGYVRPTPEFADNFADVYACAYDNPEGRTVTADDHSLDTVLTNEDPQHGLDINSQLGVAYRALNVYKDIVKKAIEDADMTEVEVDRCISRAVDLLKQGYAADDVGRCARLVRCYVGQKEYEPVLAKLGEWLPKYLIPTAADMVKCGHIVDDRDLNELKSLCDSARNMMEGASELRAVAQVLHKEAVDGERLLDDAIEASRPFVRPPDDIFAGLLNPAVKMAAPPKQRDDDEEKPDNRPFTEQMGWPATVPGAIGSQIEEGTGKGMSEYLASGTKKLMTRQTIEDNKKVTNRLKNLQREVLLQDLVTNDEVLSEADPKAISSAYAAMMQVAPEVSTNKEVARSFLRQAVHATSISPYDADALANLEKTILENTGKLPAKRKPAGADEEA